MAYAHGQTALTLEACVGGWIQTGQADGSFLNNHKSHYNPSVSAHSFVLKVGAFLSVALTGNMSNVPNPSDIVSI